MRSSWFWMCRVKQYDVKTASLSAAETETLAHSAAQSATGKIPKLAGIYDANYQLAAKFRLYCCVWAHSWCVCVGRQEPRRDYKVSHIALGGKCHLVEMKINRLHCQINAILLQGRNVQHECVIKDTSSQLSKHVIKPVLRSRLGLSVRNVLWRNPGGRASASASLKARFISMIDHRDVLNGNINTRCRVVAAY